MGKVQRHVVREKVCGDGMKTKVNKIVILGGGVPGWFIVRDI